jgi:hypothetical protein
VTGKDTDGCHTGADCQEQQAELQWRLRSVYDRAEVTEVLRQLYEDGYVRRRLGTNRRIDELGLVAVREEEEREVYWFLGDQRWYKAY